MLGRNNIILFCRHLQGFDFEGKQNFCLGQGQQGMASCMVDKVAEGLQDMGVPAVSEDRKNILRAAPCFRKEGTQ